MNKIMINKNSMEGCQMSLIKDVSIEDVKNRLHAKAFIIIPIVN